MSIFDKWIHVGSNIDESVEMLQFTFKTYRFGNVDGSWDIDAVSDFLNGEIRYEGEEFDAFTHILGSVSAEGMKDTLFNSGDVPVEVIAIVMKYTGTIVEVTVVPSKKELIDLCTDRDLRILKFCLDKHREDVEWITGRNKEQ